MNNMLTIEQAKLIMGDHFIGPNELKRISWIHFDELTKIPKIPFSEQELREKADDYLLILGVDQLADGRKMTIRNMRSVFGKNPDVKEPCFYNQDWYDKEVFIDIPMQKTWFLIRKNVYEKSRAVQPTELLETYVFPSAIKCVYAFFVVWEAIDFKLWYHDFVWCLETDHNGDRIYVGKYNDVDGVNKNGFSIHRYLSLRPCYGCID